MIFMRKKGRKPEDIKDIVKNVIKKLETKVHGTKEEILRTWARAAGSKATQHSRPVAIRQKVLTIEVDSSTWLYALNLKKKSILEDMRKVLGRDKIEDIRFKMGEIT